MSFEIPRLFWLAVFIAVDNEVKLLPSTGIYVVNEPCTCSIDQIGHVYELATKPYINSQSSTDKNLQYTTN